MGLLCMLAALAAWTALAFVYRLSESRRADRMVMVCAMNATSFAGNLMVALATGVNLAAAGRTQIVLGAANGVVGTIAIPVFMGAVARGDLSITWTVLTLSFLPAAVAGLLYPGARLTVAGTAGLILAATAISVLGMDMRRRQARGTDHRLRKGWTALMAISFVGNAALLYSFTLSAHWAGGDGAGDRLAFLMASAAVITVGTLILRLCGLGGGLRLRGLAIGAMAGALMVAGGHSSLLALGPGGVPSHVLYPVTNGGSNVLVAALSAGLPWRAAGNRRMGGDHAWRAGVRGARLRLNAGCVPGTLLVGSGQRSAGTWQRRLLTEPPARADPGASRTAPRACPRECAARPRDCRCAR